MERARCPHVSVDKDSRPGYRARCLAEGFALRQNRRNCDVPRFTAGLHAVVGRRHYGVVLRCAIIIRCSMGCCIVFFVRATCAGDDPRTNARSAETGLYEYLQSALPASLVDGSSGSVSCFALPAIGSCL